MQTKLSDPCFSNTLPAPEPDFGKWVFNYVKFDQSEKVAFSTSSTQNKLRYNSLVWKNETPVKFVTVENKSISDSDLQDALADGKIFGSLNGGYHDLVLQDLDVLNRVSDQIKSLSAAGIDVSSLAKRGDTPLDETFLDSVVNIDDNPYVTVLKAKTSQLSYFFSYLDELSNVTFFSSLSGKDAGALSSLLVYDVDSPYSGSLSSLLYDSVNNANETILKPLSTVDDGTSAPYTTRKILVVVGYLVDKYILIENEPVYKDTFALDVAKNSYDDYEILYGQTYVYQVRKVYAANLLIPDTSGALNKVGTYLFSSVPTPARPILCKEIVPPPPPVDINFFWDSSNSLLNISWNMPVNPQQDIKGFGVFKRCSIKEPFQLIAYYDFDDSVNPTPVQASILNSGVYVLVPEQGSKKYPVLAHADTEFDKKRPQIYSVMSFDAHGNYNYLSAQFEITYIAQSNKIKKRLVSHSYAPIDYPNTYLINDTFSDTVFLDDISKLTVSFDPAASEYREGGSTSPKKLYVSNPPGSSPSKKYVISMINTDLQEYFPIDINLIE